MGPGRTLEDKAWKVLRDFESTERIKAAYLKFHGRKIGTGQAREISAPFSHGRSYFESAASSDPAIRPLLLYYGVMNLSRGLVLMLSRGIRESALKASHGLTCEDWARELRRDSPDFHCLRVKAARSGAFIELSESTARCTMLRNNSSLVNMASRERGSVKGHAYCVGDLLARLPQLERSNIAWRNTSLCSIWSHTKSSDEKHMTVSIPRTHRPFVDRAYCDALFKGTSYSFIRESPKEFIYEGPNDTSQFPGFTDMTDILSIGRLWMVARYPENVWLSRAETLFSISYALGMLVRYFPAQWTALLKGHIPDAALPTIIEAIDLVSWLYPVAISDFLTNHGTLTSAIEKSHSFVGTGYVYAEQT